MYKEWISRQTHGIIKNDSYEAEPLEVKLRKATEEKKPIEFFVAFYLLYF